MNILRKKTWSPYISGMLIGLLQVPVLLLLDRPLGASSSFSVVADYIISLFSKTNLRDFSDVYNWWQLALVIGIMIGAFVSSRISHVNREPIAHIWYEILTKPSKVKRFFMGFVGGMLLLLGARLGGGCTSGHGLSGIAKLQISSIIMICCVFIGGIITANLLYKKSKKS